MPTISMRATRPPDSDQHTGWSRRLVRQVAILVLANVMVDTVVGAPLLVLPQMLDHFGTDQAAWLNASAMLAGAMWAPLLGKSADIFGKRKALVTSLLIGCAGALVCLVAPNIWVFIAGRLLQGAAVAAVFLSVALIRQICAPGIAMTVVGIVTSGSAVLGVASPFFFKVLAEEFGFRSVFLVSAVLAAVAAVCVRGTIPESPFRTGGRIDVVGAVLLGGGLAATLSYVSLGAKFGWFALGPLVLLVVGVALLVRWVAVSRRVPEPVIDIRDLRGPLVLTLVVVVLSTGAYQSTLQLISLIAQVSPDARLGYGLAAEGALGLLFAVPSVGVMVGGTLAGALATRIGPAWTLAGGVAIGTAATIGMSLSVSHLSAAVVVAGLLGFAAGAIVTSGFNLATSVASTGTQGVVSGLVQVMLGIGSVVMNVVGSAVLTSTAVVVDGARVNSAAGVHGYLAIAAASFVVATAVAILLARRQRPTPAGSALSG
ncbi:MFS transporter [Streptoalloteichus hindustanus]|uniref:Major Facilitator Superfamily protein n=1 Tax=Streptoalloteichus hindustanus TaxID=2017 RepID=A0A1M5CKH4_STRHI|nr:MFS transporter [Streptoalloteichus hindustanus]SHF55186.1 Major Facilitator Superfamily protein [Streptoalloteichus hindustanus]